MKETAKFGGTRKSAGATRDQGFISKKSNILISLEEG